MAVHREHLELIKALLSGTGTDAKGGYVLCELRAPGVRQGQHGPLWARPISKGEQEFEERNEEWPGDLG